jgi:hypothetical protein
MVGGGMIAEGNGKVDFLGRELKVGQYVVFIDACTKMTLEQYACHGDYGTRHAVASFLLGKVAGFSEQLVFVDDTRRRPENVCIVDQRDAEIAATATALKS